MTTLTATELNALTTAITGKEAGRVANRAAAEARFRREAAKAGIDADAILAKGNAFDCATALKADLEVLAQSAAQRDERIMEAAATVRSPGLARLRAHPKAEEIRQQTVAEAEAVTKGVNPFNKDAQRMEAARAADKRRGKSLAALALVEANAPAPVAKPKKERAAKPKAEKPEGAATRTRTAPEGKITAVVENPKKAGSKAHAVFMHYRAGQTVADFMKACAEAGIAEAEAKANLSWDRRKGFITVEA